MSRTFRDIIFGITTNKQTRKYCTRVDSVTEFSRFSDSFYPFARENCRENRKSRRIKLRDWCPEGKQFKTSKSQCSAGTKTNEHRHFVVQKRRSLRPESKMSVNEPRAFRRLYNRPRRHFVGFWF